MTTSPAPADQVAEQPLTSTGFGCPACGTLHDPVHAALRNFACTPCTERATDARGRRVRIQPLGTSGAVEARYRHLDGSDGDLAVDVSTFKTCFIDKHPYQADVETDPRGHHFVIVLRPLSDVLTTKKATA